MEREAIHLGVLVKVYPGSTLSELKNELKRKDILYKDICEDKKVIKFVSPERGLQYAYEYKSTVVITPSIPEDSWERLVVDARDQAIEGCEPCEELCKSDYIYSLAHADMTNSERYIDLDNEFYQRGLDNDDASALGGPTAADVPLQWFVESLRKYGYELDELLDMFYNDGITDEELKNMYPFMTTGR